MRVAPFLASLALGGLLSASVLVPAHGQEAAPVDPVTGMAIPLAPGEMAFRLKNGCSYIAPQERVAEDAKVLADGARQTRWYGHCKFGLVDGPGFTVTDGFDYKAHGRVPYQQVFPRLGYFPRVLESGDKVSLPFAYAAVEGEWFIVEVKPAIDVKSPSVLDRNGGLASFTLASRQRKAGDRTEVELLQLMKINCPPAYKSRMARELRKRTDPPLTRQQADTAGQMCDQAIQRLWDEGRISGDYPSMWGANPFETVDYGYFFVVFMQHDAYRTRADGTYEKIELPAAQKYADVVLCPRITDVASCEPIWRQRQQPFAARRDEIRQIVRDGEARAVAERERRFAPLAAAWSAKVAELRARP